MTTGSFYSKHLNILIQIFMCSLRITF